MYSIIEKQLKFIDIFRYFAILIEYQQKTGDTKTLKTYVYNFSLS